MGAGASAANNNRLRKALILRAYNVRPKGQTLEDQFMKFSFKKGSTRMVSLQAVKDALSMNAPYMDELFRACLGSCSADVEFDCFIEFLESGKSNFSVDASPKFTKNSAMEFDNISKPPRRQPGGARPVGMPPTPPRGPGPAEKAPRRQPSPQPYMSQRAVYPEVFDGLSFRRAHLKRHWLSSSSSSVFEDNTSQRSLVPRFFPEQPGSSTGAGGQVRMAPGKPLWRKREVVKSERTVHYTTVDASGLLQELVEKECTETEVLHMECRETGEFAHRETTKYEQQETFNDEIVAEEKGTEEYVHLKSQDDEIEFMESNMPRRGRPEEPPQPEEPATEYEVHEAPEEDPAGGGVYDGGAWYRDMPKGVPEEPATGVEEKQSPGPYKQDYGDWGTSSHSPPHVHVHTPFDEQAPETMLGATFEGIYGSPEPPPAYSAAFPVGSPEDVLPQAAGAFGLPPNSHLHVHPHIPVDSYFAEGATEYKGAGCDTTDSDRNRTEEGSAPNRPRRKWSPPAAGADGPNRADRAGTAPWYDNDSDVEDATDTADDSGASGPISAMGAADKDYLFASSRVSEDGSAKTARAAAPGSTHADILLQRYDSFKLD